MVALIFASAFAAISCAFLFKFLKADGTHSVNHRFVFLLLLLIDVLLLQFVLSFFFCFFFSIIFSNRLFYVLIYVRRSYVVVEKTREA